MAVYVLSLAASVLILVLLRGELRKSELARQSWEQLVEQLKAVNTAGITLAALESDSPFAFDPDEVWTMIGEWEGLRRMQANARLLIVLASHATHWNDGERQLVAEQMRRDAREIQKAVRRMKFQRCLGKGNAFLFSDTLGTVCAYYRMSERLLTLFERSPSRRYGQLTAAVWPNLSQAV